MYAWEHVGGVLEEEGSARCQGMGWHWDIWRASPAGILLMRVCMGIGGFGLVCGLL